MKSTLARSLNADKGLNRYFLIRNEEMIIQHCVACSSSRCHVTEEWKGYQLAICSECGLTFTVNPDYKAERYVSAYEDTGDEAPLSEEYGYVYAAPGQRLKLEARALLVPPPRLTPVEKLALKWLIRHVRKSAAVIDCGCGAGRFLRALQKTGFQAVGVELSEILVELLNRSGLKAVKGMAPDFSWDGPEPCAITFFEVLEHIPNPGNVVQRLKARFPKAFILASVPSPSRVDLLLYGRRGISDSPPNHFLRWTPKALELFFKGLGYSKVTVVLPPPIGSELMPGLGQILSTLIKFQPSAASKTSRTGGTERRTPLLKRTEATAAVWLLQGYQRVMDLIGAPKAWSAACKGASAASMLVIVQP